MKFTSWCSLSIGILMLVQWVFFLATGQVPEIRTAPIALTFHLLAEVITASALILAGAGLLKRRRGSRVLAFVANGMLIYTVIASPGYFAQSGQWAFVGMFIGLLVLVLVSIVLLAHQHD